MLIRAFIPYRVESGSLNGYGYDTEQTRTELAVAFRSLGTRWIWQPITAENTAAAVESAATRNGEASVVFNFCDGLDGKGTPGISVVRELECAGVPFTGADSGFYCLSTSKLAMKRVFLASGIPTPPFAELPCHGAPDGVFGLLGAPLLLKPDISAASCGIGLRSKVCTPAQVLERRDALQNEASVYADYGTLFVERFIQGREFTALVVGDWRRPESVRCLPPAERRFNRSIPPGERFLTYDRYWNFHAEEPPPPDGLPFYGYAGVPPGIALRVANLSRAAFCALRGNGYARVTLREDGDTGELFVLEVNANCGLSCDDQTSTGCILHLAGLSLSDLFDPIIRHAVNRNEI